MLRRIDCSFRLILAVLLVFSLLAVSSCAFSPVERPKVTADQGSKHRQVKLPRKQAIELACLAATSMGYDILSVDHSSGYIKTNVKPMPIAGNAHCGSWNGTPIKGMATSAMFIKVLVLSQNTSLIKVTGLFGTRFKGRNLYGMVTRDETFRCASMGNLEYKYLEVVERLAKNWSPKEEKQAEAAAQKPKEAPKAAPPPKAKDKGKAAPGAAVASQDAAPAAPPADEPENPRLKKLKMLKAMGLLSEDEFQKEKAKLGLGGK